MTLRQLEYFTAVADEGTFQAAADKLHITQPPLSVQIRLLEEEVGTPLLLRGPRHVTLTDAGQLLYSRASNILRLEQNTEQEMHDYVAGNRGTLRLGMASSTVNDLLDQMIVPFSVQFPGIRFELTESNTYHLLDLLQHNLIDAALIRQPFQPGRNALVHELKKDRLAAVGFHDCFHPSDRNSMSRTADPEADASLPLSSLAAVPLIVYRRWKDILDQCFDQNHLTPYYYCIADDARTCLSWARRGLGIAIVPLSAMDPEAAENPRMEQHPIVHPEISTSICLVTRGDSSNYLSVPLQALIRALQHD